MKFVALCMMAVFLVLSGSGCSWVGRTTGKLQRKIERKADNLESGYQQGYAEENQKIPASGGTSGTSGTAAPQNTPANGATTPLEN